MDSHIVPDTSVLIKWFRQGEVLADRALVLRRAYLDGQIQISAPVLAAYELANVLRYKNDLTTAQVEEAVQSLFDLGLGWVLPSDTLLRRAVVIARESVTTVYDASFVALAEALAADFITADEQLIPRLAAFPFTRFLGEMGQTWGEQYRNRMP
jgi:predicted nucleic acid-binding protein